MAGHENSRSACRIHMIKGTIQTQKIVKDNDNSFRNDSLKNMSKCAIHTKRE